MATFMSLLSFLLYNDSTRVYKLTKAITYTRSKINFVLLKFILWLLRAVDDKSPEWRFSLHTSSMCAGGTVNGFVGWSRNDICTIRTPRLQTWSRGCCSCVIAQLYSAPAGTVRGDENALNCIIRHNMQCLFSVTEFQFYKIHYQSSPYVRWSLNT